MENGQKETEQGERNQRNGANGKAELQQTAKLFFLFPPVVSVRKRLNKKNK